MVEDLPAFITEAARNRVNELSLRGQGLRVLPPEIGELRDLLRLDLGDNQLTDVPPEVCGLSNLSILDLSANSITALPPEIRGLQQLKWLNLNANSLTTLPRELGGLQRLGFLYLEGNLLTALPEAVGQLENLEVLQLGNNRIGTVSAKIGRLSRLWALGLQHNALEALPPEIGRLQSLRNLQLSSNRLTALPVDFGMLRSLSTLQLSENRLKALPQQLATLPLLRLDMHLEGNPWNEPLATIVPHGPEAVLTYLRSLSDAAPYYEARVLLVGEGNVGKSTLVAALCGAPFVEGRPTTHGIEVGRLTLRDLQVGCEMTLNTWDFGGQEVYRVTHQFFFSPRSLYILVWKPREGKEENAIEDWLKRIKLRVRDARVIVVATHADERHPELDYPYLRQRFGVMLADRPFEVDSRSGLGIQELRDAIATEAAKLPQMGELLSQRWTSTRDEILRLHEPQIARSVIRDICERNHLDEPQTKALLVLMHDVGYIIHYGDDEGLRDTVVLQPEWLTKAISYVLEDRPTIQAGGELDHARLRQIWADHNDPGRESYPSVYHPYFLRLMEKFDICYRLEGENSSLVAQLVPVEQPELPWTADSLLHQTERELALYCHMKENPPGLIAWLTVRNHRFSTGRHWRRGVFLEHQEHQALIQLDRQISIWVRGSSPDYFFSLIRDSLEYLLKTRWPGLEYDLETPCPNREVDGRRRCSGRFKFRKLIEARELNLSTLQCQECFKHWSPSQLLTGFGSAANLMEVKLDRMEGLIRQGHQDQALLLRTFMKALNAESRDSPRLFSLVPLQTHDWDPRFVGMTAYKLQLWCEHPQHQHPAEGGDYTVTQAREWLVKLAPYASFVAKALKLAMPLVAPATEMILEKTLAEAVKPQLELMERITSELLEGELDVSPKGGGLDQILSGAEGAGLRQLQSLLLEKDPSRKWGDLRRVLNSAGDYLWVCPKHYSEYDPGLPVLPGPQEQV